MEKTLYSSMAKEEDTHWWFSARRIILRRLLRGLSLPAGAAIMEAGCGTGGNLKMLSEFGSVQAMEMDADGRAFAAARNVATVKEGWLPDNIPFPDESFDLIAVPDVLEHLEQDEASLRALREKLKPGGKLLLTVPAFMFLWGPHDTAHHHFRRYRLPQVQALLERAGFRVNTISYFNFWLFPLIAAVRIVTRKSARAAEDAAIERSPRELLNWLLRLVFASEALLLSHGRLPFGVSIVAIGERV